MLNAPRHRDHHLRPGRIYPALQLERASMRILRRSLPVMGTVAPFPRWWRRVMDLRVAALRAGAPAKPRHAAPDRRI